MTAGQQAADAFDREWQHALSSLPLRPCLSDHTAVLKHRRCELSIQELLQYYSRKLPAYLYGPRLLSGGAQLQDRHDYRLAAELCFQRLADLNLPGSPDSSRKLDAVGRLGLHVQALYGLHASHAAEALLQDSSLQHQHTITVVLSALAGLQAACQLVVPAQPMLVHEGTQHIHEVASRLLPAGLHAQLLPHLLFAARAMECHISLSSIEYLQWRVQLYATATACYCALLAAPAAPAPSGEQEAHSTAVAPATPTQLTDSPCTDAPVPTAEQAMAVLAAGLSQLASIARAQALDAVPAPDITAAVQAAQAQLTLLQLLFEQQAEAGAGADPAAAASQLLASIGAIGSSKEQLTALLRLLQAGLAAYSCPLQQVQLPASLQPAMEAAAELAAQVLGLASPETGQDTSADTFQARTANGQLHQELLSVAYRYQQQELFHKLLAAALDSTAAPEPAAAVTVSSHDHGLDYLVATAAVLDAVSKLHDTPGDSAMQHLAAVLVQHSEALGSCSHSLLAAAALELHAAASPVLEGCFSQADSNAELTQALLEGLHAALQHAGHVNGVRRGSVALRLAALLEEQQQLGSGLEVVEQGLAAIVTASCDALTHLQGQVDEHLRWISGSRTQPDNATAALLEGMSDTEQVLACLHADAVLLKTRLQLKQGMHEAAAKATSRQQRMQTTLQKRDQQADIFGARTQKERRLDAAAVQAAGLAPQTALEVEQRLLQDCGGCPYQQALVLTATALVQPDVNRQTALLEEACDALQAAHASEAELFGAQQPAAEALRPLSAHHIKPLNPKVLCRTQNSISLTVFPVKVAREARKPAVFAAYCKPCAAGVSLTVNKTSMEYPGSGVQVPIDGRVTIEGLQGGETYNFAVAVFDNQGTLLGELGISSPPITMTLPLPVYYCYAHVLLAAARLGLWTVAKSAATVLLPRFFTTTAVRPVWQAHPVDRFTLQSDQVAAQVAPFLRLLVQAVYAYAGHLGTKQLTSLQDGGSSSFGGMEEAALSSNGLAGTAASRALLLNLSESHLPQQVALLEAARRHLLAMQVAAKADDEMLVQEGALRTFNLLSPLLQQQDISPTLFQPLSELHSLVAAVKDTAPSSVSGHKQQRQQAAQALATAGYWKLRLLEPVGPGFLCGSAAVAAHGVIGLQLKPSAALNALDGALLRVLAGALPAAASVAPETSSAPAKAGKGGKKQTGHKTGRKTDSIPEGSAVSAAPQVPVGEGAEQAQELAALQELLLWHPQGALWAADLHASRCNDPNDLVAQVLPKLEQLQALITCWPLLSAQAAYSHPKWLQLCVLLMQAASKQHGAALWLCLPSADKTVNTTSEVGVTAESLPEAARAAATPQMLAAAAAASELFAAVKQQVRMTARRPQFLAWANSPKWTVDSAAAALEAEGFVLGDQGTAPALPQPEMAAGATAAATKAATAAWQKQNADLLVQERRRLAAALLLQQRLPVLLGRRTAILAARRQLAAWAPWLGQLHSLVGSMAAEAAAQLLALKVPALPVKQPAAAEFDVTQTQTAEGGTAAAGLAAAAPTDEPAAPPGADLAATVDAAAISAGAAATVEGQPAAAGPTGTLASASRPGSPRKGVLETTKAEGQAAVGAAGGSKTDTLDSLAEVLALQAHQQFAQAATLTARSSSHQQLFNTSKQLQGISKYLLNKIPGLLEPVPAVQWSIQPLPEPTVLPLLATAPERPVTDPTLGGKGTERRSTAGGKAPAEKKQAGVPAAKGPSGRPSAATPRADAKHTLLPEPRTPHVGAAFRSVAAALLAAMQQLCSQLSPVPPPTADSGSAGQAARSYATSFSFGSDALIEAWHTDSGIDVAGLTQILALVVRALHKTERWHCMLELGGAWMEICQGAADAVLVSLLLSAARNVGSSTDLAALTAAQQALAADRNVALEELNRVRLLVSEWLHGLPPLDAAFNSSSTSTGSTSPSRPPTATRKASMPDHVLLPAEYDKVVSQLKKRGEKGHMILALNELGDVHAHLGDWSQASEAWSSAVDALLGPYRVVETWRSKLELGEGAVLLRRYGVHGLLLAATILGKLARYTYHGDLGSRLSCALLSAELLPAVFAGDIIHPQRRLDFAAYVPLELWPGAEVFDEPYRCNAAALASSLECLTSILQEQQLHLQTLPLLTLWEHTSLHVAHNRASTVLARITRVRVLAALGLMPQAATVLHSLMQGSNLPGIVLVPSQPLLGAGDSSATTGAGHHTKGKGHAAEGKDSSSKESKEAATAAGVDALKGLDSRPVLYHADKWAQDPANAAFLQLVADAVLDPAVVTAYGPWLCGHFILARAAFLAAAGGVVDCWVDGKPSALAAAARAGPPPPVDPSTAASSAEASNEPAVPPATGPAAKGAKPAAGSTSGAAAGAGAAGGKAAAAAASAAAPPPPARTPAEFKLLDAAVQLLQGLVSVSCPASGMSAAVLGIPWADQGAPVEHAKAKIAAGKGAAGKDKTSSGSHGSTAKKGHGATKGGKGSPQKHGKGDKAGAAAQQQPPEQQDGAEAAAAERRAAAAAELLAAQHQYLLIEALLQLAAVQAARWMPLQALPVCLAACEAIKHAAGSSGGSLVWVDSPLDSSQAEAKGALLPGSSTWLAARWQLAHILLQLQHHGPCAAVCLKALTDAARAADVAWSARLLQVQAAALAAQEDYPQALNCYRAALTRLEEHGLPSSLVLPIQLDYAALCDEIGSRGDFDKLSGTNLAVSIAAVQDMGLSEMMEHPKLTSIYLPAAATHLTALLAAASAATRRRQLASAERHLRTAADMLACCRCTPVHAAAVLTGLARVLRLQAVLKLPDTAIAGATAESGFAADPGAQQQQQPVIAAGQHQQQLMASAGSSHSGSKLGSGAHILQLQQRRLHEAAHLLGAGVRVLIADAGSNPVLVRASLLELAAVLVQAAATSTSEQLSDSRNDSTADPAVAAKVASVLRAAHVTAGHVCKLFLDSHSLQPVQSPGTCLPDWLLELLHGHEQLQSSLQQEAAAAAAAIASKTGTKPSAGAAGNGSGNAVAATAASTAGKQTATAAATDAGTAGSTASAGTTVSDAALGRLAVCFYMQQLIAMSSGGTGLQRQQIAAEQALLVQPVLRAACAKFAVECCWADVPPEVITVLQSLTVPVPNPLPALPTGSVFVQWYRQDGCWQSPSSWACHGTLPPTGQITSEALASLPKQHPCVSCLYVLIMPAPAAAAATGGTPCEAATATAAGADAAAGPVVLQGELVVSLERAKRVQLQVKAMRGRLEAPGKPTDIIAKPAPSTVELATVKHNLECLLAAIAEDDMPPAPADLPPPVVQPVQAATPTAVAAGGPAAGGAKGAPAAAAGKPPPSAKSSVAAGAAAAAAATGKAVAAAGTPGAAGGAAAGANSAVADPALLQLEWRQVETWAKVEMLMDLEGGLQVADAAVALWLGGVLQGQLSTVGTQGWFCS